jgi:DNA-binding CsgD family transcriptional regulator
VVSVDGITDWWLMGVTGALAFGGTGAWLTWTQPRQPLGWVLLGIGSAAGLSLGATEWGLWAIGRGGAPGGDRPGAVVRQLGVGGLDRAGRVRRTPARPGRAPAVASGEIVFSPAVADRVLGWSRSGGRPGDRLAPFPELTEREREVLDLVARGLTNAEIARRLVVSDKTVRIHVSNVFAKLHVTDRASAVARARDAGLGAAPTH